MGDKSRPGDFDHGREAALECIGSALAPEDDDGGEDWGLPNVVRYIVAEIGQYLPAGWPPGPSPDVVRGAAQFLRDLADGLDDKADEMSRSA